MLSQRDLFEQIKISDLYNVGNVEKALRKPQRQRAWLIFGVSVAIFWGIRKPQTFQMKTATAFKAPTVHTEIN